MKKTIVWIASVIGAAAVLTLGFVWFMNTRNERMVAVSGECLTTAPKDRTAISLRVSTLDKSAAVSMKMATSKIAEITEYLKSLDVKMQTTQFDSYEKTEWNQAAQKSISLGIETTIAMEVSANKIETIEAVLNKFAGADNVYSENLRMFTSTETLKPILEECLGDAIENARERATAIAVADGRKVGKMISASYDAGSASSIVRPTSNFMRGAKLEAAAFDVAGGLVSKDTEVSVSVSAVFDIK